MKKSLAMILTLLMTLGVFSLLPVSAANVEKYIEAAGTPICDVMAPQGGGNKFIRVIKDGLIPETKDQALMQYDTYRKDVAGEHESYFGYTFEESFDITAVEFYEGLHYANGGWFANGSAKIQALVGEEWVDVTLTNQPAYPSGNTEADFGNPFECYTFTFAPVSCTGIRIIGQAGGPKYFTSCSELKVKAMVDEKKEIVDPVMAEKLAKAKERYEQNHYLEGFATPITNGAPGGTSGGSQDVGVINDGVTVALDNDNNRLQFDTYNAAQKTNIMEYIGYTFEAPYEIEKIIYQTGKMWATGGWFGYGFEVEILVHGTWKKLNVTVTPEYPDSNEEKSFTSFATYEISFDKVVCEGVRLTGLAGGSRNYISCTELTVQGDMAPDLTEYNASAGKDENDPTNPGGDTNQPSNPGDNQGNTQKPTQKPSTDTGSTTAGTDATTEGGENKKSGCGSSLNVYGVSFLLTSLIAVGGIGMTFRKKKTGSK